MFNLFYTALYILLGIFSIVMILMNAVGLALDDNVGKYEKRRIYIYNSFILLYMILGLVRGI